MTRHRLNPLPILLAAVSVWAAGDPAVELLDRPDAKWRQGPVSYILGKDEDAQFRKLKTDDERKTFIEAFWSRRDPTPGTPANEFKDLYARRLSLAVAKFSPPDGRGWEEDRGKVVILLGAPDQVEIRESQAPGTGADSDGSTPTKKAIFLYKDEVLPGIPAPLKLEFIQESGGGYRLLTRFDFGDPRVTGLTPLPVKAPPPAAPAPTAPIAAAPQPAAPEAPPPSTPQQTLMEEVLGGPTPASKIPIAARLDFYKTTEGGALATLTLAVKKGAAAAPDLLAARILKGGDEAVAKLERENSFEAAQENASIAPGADLLFQAVRDLDPGKYSLVAAAKDTSTGDVGFVLLQSIEVPDFHGETLQMSSVTLARRVERLPSAPGAGARFTLGNFKVLPAPRAQFRAGEDVWVYYQIYNTASDPASGQPKLKVTYRYEKVEKAGNRVLGGRPIEQKVSNTVQMYAVGVQPAWPAGDYQVVVKVEDLVATTSVSSTVPFSVVK
jgi:GWxTD domain-containing protein